MKIISLTAENIKRLTAVYIEPDGNLVEITGKNGAGKQQPVSEPVLTPNGWVPIGDLSAGDEVIGANGRATAVLNVFPQTERRTLRVEMADGASVRCGPDHLWTVSFWRSGKGCSNKVTETMSTVELMDRGIKTNKGKSRRFSIASVEPVEFADTGMEMPIDAYTLGVILGDGHIEPTGYTTITSWDKEILDAVDVGGWRAEHEYGTGAFSRPLRHLGLNGKLSYEKFIPSRYFTAPVADRAALLAGLLDTDGTAPAQGSWAEYCTTSEQLAQDVVRLGLSLGFVCKKRTPNTKKYRYNGELKEGRLAYGIIIKSNKSPFRLNRKTEKWSPSSQRGDLMRHIDSINDVDPEDSVCIQVAANDGLYVTKDFILTHNTSVLDAIWWALTGGKSIQTTPVRKGAERGMIKLDLGELIVTRKFLPKENGSFTTSITVVNADGAKFQAPQEIISKLIGSLTMDPLEFQRMKPPAQVELLKHFVSGFDFDEMKRLQDADFEARTEINRDTKRLKANVASVGYVPDDEAPEIERVDLDDLIAQMANSSKHNDNIKAEISAREAKRLKVGSHEDTAKEKRAAAVRLQGEADAMEKMAEELTAEIKGSPAIAELVNVDDLQAKIAVGKDSNALLDARNNYKAKLVEIADSEAKSAALTSAMEERKKAAAQAVASSEMPVDGISFDDGAITLNGVPFEQASDAEQLQASIKFAMAMNPKLRVIRIRDGSLLDDEGMKMIAKIAVANDFQFWVERVDSSGSVGFVIEDGHVKGVDPDQEEGDG